MNAGTIALLTAAMMLPVMTSAGEQYRLSSPDGALELVVEVGENIAYSLSHDGGEILGPSPVSMTLEDGTVYGLRPGKAVCRRVSEDKTIESPFYKKAEIEDKYNEMTLKFKTFSMIFRAYDEGVAYRFVSGSRSPFRVVSEQAVFNFPEDTHAFVPYVSKFDDNGFESQFYNSFENTYQHILLSEWDSRRLAFLPIVAEAAGGRKVCITEADLMNYPGMYLHNPDGGRSLNGVFAPVPDKIEQGGHNMLQGVVKSRKPYIAECGPGEVFPWRVIIVSGEDKELADNDMVYKLASPQREDMDFSWVKPGKVAWEWWNDWNLRGVDFKTGINNETYKYYIDFASAHGIPYVILDEGWAVNLKADLMQVVPEIDLKGLVEYAETEDADIIVFGGIPAPNQEKAPQWIWERMSPRFIVYDGKNAGAEALFKEKSSTPFLWLHFIKRELFEKPTKLRLHEDLDLGEDQVFQFMYFPRAEKLIFWDKQYYYYRWDNEGSLMWKYNHMPTEKFRKHLKIVETVFQEWEKAKYKDPYGRLVSWMVNFLYDDWKAFPAYLQSEFAGQIVDMAEKGDQSLYMSDEYQIDRAKEIEQKAKNADGGEKETEEQILLLKASISAIEGEIQELIHSKSFRLGKMLTPKKKRLDMQSILPPERKKN